jgi:Notch-like protein
MCETEIDECATDPCSNQGVCIDEIGFYSCNCTDTGYEGVDCEVDFNDCLGDPCLNNGTCSDDGSIPNAFNCTCESGYSGTFCEIDPPPCEDMPCLNNGTCTEDLTNLTYECACTEAYTGTNCELDVVCASSPCTNNGTCVDAVDDSSLFTCTCEAGYTGATCEIEVDGCEAEPCHVAGTSSCFNLGAALFDCKCLDGWSGEFCEIHDFCNGTQSCENGGTCVLATSTCNCVEGFMDEFCETEVVGNVTYTVAYVLTDGETIDSVKQLFILAMYTGDDWENNYNINVIEGTNSGEYELTVTYFCGSIDPDCDNTNTFAEVIEAVAGAGLTGIVQYEEDQTTGDAARVHMHPSVMAILAGTIAIVA